MTLMRIIMISLCIAIQADCLARVKLGTAAEAVAAGPLGYIYAMPMSNKECVEVDILLVARTLIFKVWYLFRIEK